MTATFPHQSRNVPCRDRLAWREGRLCLDTPLGGERRVVVVRDPVGDADQRLRWHAERALEWLHRAANDQLLAVGDPFELPERPHTAVRGWLRDRVVHDESAASFTLWDGRAGTFGTVRLGALRDIGNVLAVKSFEDQRGEVVRAWSGRELADLANERRVNGFWWLWPQPVVSRPWHAPGTWRDLRRIAKAMNVEPFGPLALINPVRSLDEAIEKSNALPFGLAAYGFARSAANVDRIARGLEAGNVSINTLEASRAETPFGGVKDSGLGREGGAEGILHYTIVKTISHLVE